MSCKDVAISVRGLTKSYRLFDHPADRVKQFLSLGLKRYHREFTALEGVSFEIKKGETIGIIGRNGSGKSTLLQLLCGILKPTSGSVQTNGRVSALLELGAGFNPEFTGRENVYFQGAVLGFTQAQMNERFDAIAAFADIGEFMEQPVRTYSSGMFVRLAFSVAIHVEPDILIVDEALSVGDITFQAKGMQRMSEMMDAGCTLILVSHDIGAVKSLCDRAIRLDHGRIVADGSSGMICDNYVVQQLLGNKDSASSLPDTPLSPSRGSGTARIISVEADPAPAPTFMYGQELTLRVHFMAEQSLEKMVVSFYIKDAQLLEVLGTCTTYEGVQLGPFGPGEGGCVEFRFRNPLRAGTYWVTAILADEVTNTCHYYDWLDHACHFESHDIPNQKRWAFTCPEMTVIKL